MALTSSPAEIRPDAAQDLTRSAAELQQKDYLCGPFHVARVLRDAGVTGPDGEPVDQDLVALRSGTLLPTETAGPHIPPGTVSRRDYRYELGCAEPARSGTSAGGLALAVADLSGGRLAGVPLTGHWTAAVVEGLLDRVEAFRDTRLRLIANVRTGLLWGSRPPIEALLAALDGHDLPDAPAADWDVGHFVELAVLLRGPRGSLVLVEDSYPSLGWMGRYLQPPAALAAALTRGDGREGGVLAVAASDAAHGIEELAEDLGLRSEIWDN
jgi:hypothetical protein